MQLVVDAHRDGHVLLIGQCQHTLRLFVGHGLGDGDEELALVRGLLCRAIEGAHSLAVSLTLTRGHNVIEVVVQRVLGFEIVHQHSLD